jgi:cytochrome c biogenesis protein CcdA
VGTVPITVAVVAGGLAVINPCAFPLLPAFLSFYLGADDAQLPRAGTRVAQGLLVGALVAVGFLGLFALASLPISFGVGAIAQTVPWAGIVTGALLALAGLVALLGVHLPSPVHLHVRVRRERRAGAIVMFGIGYGAASLGCTLPIFLALVGASLGGGKVAVFSAYAVGMTVVLMSFSVAVALLRGGVSRFVRPLLPHMNRIAGALLVVSGSYLTYYWARIRFGNTATLADDPLVWFPTRYVAQIQGYAQDHAWPLLLVAVAVLVAATAVAYRQSPRRHAAARRLARR